jgi:hypothetical protein
MPHFEPHEAVGPPIVVRPEPPAEDGSLAARIDALQAPTGHDDETDLTRRLAEVLRKPVKRANPALAPRSPSQSEPVDETEIELPQATTAAAPDRRDWDADARSVARASEVATEVRADVASPRIDGSDEFDETVLPPQASAWVASARRQRLRAALKSAVSWTISVSVSLAIVAVAAWILLGRPTDIEALRKLSHGLLGFG